MSDQPTPTPESSEQRWERIDRTLDRITARQEAFDRQREEQARQTAQHRAEFDLFQRTMAAIVESLHQNDLKLTAMSKANEQTMRRLDENLARLTDIVVDHHDRLSDHQERLDEREG